MTFVSRYSCTTIPELTSICLIFEQGQLCQSDQAKNILPVYADLSEQEQQNLSFIQLGNWQGESCFLGLNFNFIDFSVQLQKTSLRTVFSESSIEQRKLINLGYHIYQWHKDSRFCSRCGVGMQFMPNQLGKFCNSCSFQLYPRINPCIIVAIVKNKSAILLAEISRNNRRFSSVLAGFVEAGENLEDCVKREVYEEVGIQIKNLKYFGSQAWSFSQSLMVAYVAEHESGDIQVDGEEIQFAQWFEVDKLPDLPPEYSIARDLIEWFRNQQKPNRVN